MTYNELQQIVRELKKKITCQECKEKFLNEDFEIISTYQEQAVILANCFACKFQIIIQVTILDKGNKTNKQKIDIAKTEIPIQLSEAELEKLRSSGLTNISANDILDLHVFLTKFNGDFKTLFNEHRKK